MFPFLPPSVIFAAGGDTEMELKDELHLLQRSIDDLYSVDNVIRMAESDKEHDIQWQVLGVVRRAVDDIAGSLAEITAELEIEALKTACMPGISTGLDDAARW